MALFSSMFRGREAKKDNPKEGAPATPVAASVTQTPAPPPPPMEKKVVPPRSPLAVDEMVSAIQQIEDILGPLQDVEESEVSSGKLFPLHLRLADMVGIMPTAFDASRISTMKPDEGAVVFVEDIFGQLARGRVETVESYFLAGVPKHLLADTANLDGSNPVRIPLPLVVDAINPEELKKRTTSVRRDISVKDLPNLFTRAEEEPAEARGAVAMPEAAAATAAAPEPAVQPSLPRTEPTVAAPAEPVPVAKAVPSPSPVVEKPPVAAAAAVKPPIEERQRLQIRVPAPASPAAEVPPAVKPAPAPAAAAPALAKPVPPPPAPPSSVAARAPASPTLPSSKPAPAAAATPAETTLPRMVMPPPKIVPLFASVEAPPATPLKPAAVPPPAPVVVTPPTPAPPAPVAASEPAAPPVTPNIPALMLKGIDLNRATSADLVTRLDGIGPLTADRIVQDRAQNGPFFDVYELFRVRGIGSRVIEKITGRTWPEDLYGQFPIVMEILGRWEDRLPQLQGVVGRFRTQLGFDGCAIIHRDGDLLAASWENAPEEELEAMAPQIVKRVTQYMKNISPDETLSVTANVEGRSLTFVQSEDIIFAAIHNSRGYTRKHLQVVHGVGMALGRRFSGRREAG
jgi:competence ComEA-like helix-hairpin-helix protein